MDEIRKRLPKKLQKKPDPSDLKAAATLEASRAQVDINNIEKQMRDARTKAKRKLEAGDRSGATAIKDDYKQLESSLKIAKQRLKRAQAIKTTVSKNESLTSTVQSLKKISSLQESINTDNSELEKVMKGFISSSENIEAVQHTVDSTLGLLDEDEEESDEFLESLMAEIEAEKETQTLEKEDDHTLLI